MRKIIGLIFVVGVILSSGAFAASFDCRKAASPIENAICFDPALSEMDDDLSRVYKGALASGADRNVIKTDQKAWLKRRNQCRDNDCLKSAYQDRIAILQTMATSSSVSGLTGTYQVQDEGSEFYGEVKILQVSENTILFEMNITYHMNQGELSGNAMLNNNSAAYSSQEYGDCMVLFNFMKGELELKQSGSCGMGLNVSSTGRYKQTSHTPPRL